MRTRSLSADDNGACLTGSSVSGAADVATMAYSHDENQKDVVVDLVDDGIVAGSDPPLAVPADQLLGPAGPGVGPLLRLGAAIWMIVPGHWAAPAWR